MTKTQEPHAPDCPARTVRNDDCLCGYTATHMTKTQELPTAFTPGPWQAWIVEKTICVLGPRGDHNKPVIGWPGFDSCHLPLAKQKANARLIAAAPELYQVVTDLLSYPSVRAAIGDKFEAHALGILTRARSQS